MKKILLFTALIFFVLFAKAQRKNLILNLNFNDGSLNKVTHRDIYDNNAQTVSDSISHNGQKSVRFEVKSGNAGDKGIRSEFSFPPETSPERWYALSIFAPKSYVPDPEPEIVTQWHNMPDLNLGESWTSPSLSLMSQNGSWIFTTMWDTARVTRQGHWMGQIPVNLGTVKLNDWTKWVFHIKFSYKSDGLVEIYKNGIKVYTRQGPNCYNDAILPYWKVGIYKWVYKDHTPSKHKANQRILYYSDIREGNEKATFADVTP